MKPRLSSRYFYDFLTVTKSGASGIVATAMGHIMLAQASL